MPRIQQNHKTFYLVKTCHYFISDEYFIEDRISSFRHEQLVLNLDDLFHFFLYKAEQGTNENKINGK